MNWKKKIVKTLVNPVKAAVSHFPLVRGVAFNFEGALVMVDLDFDATLNCVQDVRNHLSALGLEARVCVQRERPFAFTNHVGISGLVSGIRVGRISPDIGCLIFELTADELKGMQESYSYLSKESSKYNIVGTFALGGFPFLNWLAIGEGDTHPKLEASRKKLHVFSGLLWDKKGRFKKEFFDWLDSLNETDDILLFDTSFSGGAVGRLVNVLKEWYASAIGTEVKEISVIGILDAQKSGLVEPSTENMQVTRGDESLNIQIHQIQIPKILTEDKEDLIGFESYRMKGQINAMWSRVLFVILDSNQNIVHLADAANAAGYMGCLIRKGKVFTHDPKKDSELQACELALILHNSLTSIQETEERHLNIALENGLINRKEFDGGIKEIGAMLEKVKDRVGKHYGLT